MALKHWRPNTGSQALVSKHSHSTSAIPHPPEPCPKQGPGSHPKNTRCKTPAPCWQWGQNRMAPGRSRQLATSSTTDALLFRLTLRCAGTARKADRRQLHDPASATACVTASSALTRRVSTLNPAQRRISKPSVRARISGQPNPPSAAPGGMTACRHSFGGTLCARSRMRQSRPLRRGPGTSPIQPGPPPYPCSTTLFKTSARTRSVHSRSSPVSSASAGPCSSAINRSRTAAGSAAITCRSGRRAQCIIDPGMNGKHPIHPRQPEHPFHRARQPGQFQNLPRPQETLCRHHSAQPA